MSLLPSIALYCPLLPSIAYTILPLEAHGLAPVEKGHLVSLKKAPTSRRVPSITHDYPVLPCIAHYCPLLPSITLYCPRLPSIAYTVVERWGAGVETQKNVRGEIGGWGRVPFNETYAPSLSTIYDGA